MSSRPNLYDYIKILALVSMIFDHIGYFLFPEQIRRRVVGRIAFPLFLFLVGYNLSWRWRRSLWVPAILIQVAIFRAYAEGLSETWTLNILLAIGITRVVLQYVSKLSRSMQLLIFLVACVLALQTFSYIDYGTLSIAFGFLGYRLRTSAHRFYKALLMVLVSYHLLFMLLTRPFPPETYFWLIIAGLIIVVFCLSLSKKNSSVRVFKPWDQTILFLSKNALFLYILQGAVLFLVGYVLEK